MGQHRPLVAHWLSDPGTHGSNLSGGEKKKIELIWDSVYTPTAEKAYFNLFMIMGTMHFENRSIVKCTHTIPCRYYLQCMQLSFLYHKQLWLISFVKQQST